MNYLELIRKKRDGAELCENEIKFLVDGVASGNIPDYQLSAFLMAAYFKGMTPHETALLTDSMANSGDTLDLSMFGSLSADKHSTGGVGDKTTLIIAPTVAALGGKVAKMSGRALGHTGGTVDKLESIPGYKCELSPANFLEQVEKIGIAVIGQSASFAPADKSMYALRDVTATVNCAPLIASSIMSKKLAAGSHNIVLDVKVGSGAFLRTTEEAYELARMMTDIGRRCNRNVRAVLTDMDKPLGNAVGNVLEVKEAIDVLRGRGPDDLREVAVTLAGLLTAMIRGISDDEGISLARETLASGASYEKFKEWIGTQGGDTRYITAPELFGEASVTYEVKAESSGYVSAMDTEAIGLASTALGAGRVDKASKIDPLAGITLIKKTGDEVLRGETIALLHTSSPELAENGARIFNNAVSITSSVPEKRSLIFDIV
ncbi:MAG: thymidine phosphorylase [Clostridia bacterium]|nr:thymidine phosphorylase [Clostridia bacterium]